MIAYTWISIVIERVCLFQIHFWDQSHITMVWNTGETGEIDIKSSVWDSSCSIDWKLELASSRAN